MNKKLILVLAIGSVLYGCGKSPEQTKGGLDLSQEYNHQSAKPKTMIEKVQDERDLGSRTANYMSRVYADITKAGETPELWSDYIAAIEERALNEEEAFFQELIGLVYDDGFHVAEDDEKALVFYQKAFSRGNESGYLASKIAKIYAKKGDQESAMKWYTDAWTFDYTQAAVDAYSLTNVPAEKRLDLLKQCIDLGNKVCMKKMGDHHKAQNQIAEAFNMYSMAGKLYEPNAAVEAGLMMMRGQGVEKNVDEGVTMLRLPERIKSGVGLYALYLEHTNGTTLPKDEDKAQEYLLMAAELGHRNAIELIIPKIKGKADKADVYQRLSEKAKEMGYAV